MIQVARTVNGEVDALYCSQAFDLQFPEKQKK
jgi:hypothetical protein